MRPLSRPRRRSALLASATATMMAMFTGIVGPPLPVRAAPPSSAPQNVRVASTATGVANLAWDAPSWGGNVNGRYTVLVNGNVFSGCANISATTCKVTGAANATAVSLAVRALGDVPTEYTQSDPVQTTLLPPPDKPTAVTATASGNLRATVSWTPPGNWRLNTVRKFDVLVDNVVHDECRDLSSATTTCSFSGALGNHAVKVRAVGNTGLSNDSDPAVTVKLVNAPGAPTDIHLTASDAGSGTIAWTSHPNGNVNPTFTVKVEGEAVTQCTAITATTCSFEADAISVQVVVTAIGDAPDLTADSATTELTLLSPPDAPTGVHAVPAAWDVGTATVAWDAPSFNGSGNNTYAVLVDGAVHAGCENLDVTQCVITGTPGTTVSVVVRAIGDVGLRTDSSPPVTIDLPDRPDAVSAVRVTDRTLGHTRIEWNAPADWHENNASQKYDVSAPGTTGCTAITVLYCDVTGGLNTTVPVTVTAVGNSAALSRDTTLSNVTIPDVPGVPANVRSVATAAGWADIVWDAPAWNNNTNQTYAVTVDGDPATCADTAIEACRILGSGTVDVQVTAIGDDEGTLSSAPTAVTSFTLIAVPDGVVGPVDVTAPAGQGVVTVTWPPLTATQDATWSGGSTHEYRVTITAKPDGATLTGNGCAALIDDATRTCSFTTDKGGTYSATVTAVNEAGAGAASAAGTVGLVRSAPTGPVTGLTTTSTFNAGKATVAVAWNQLPAGAWNGGNLSNEYVVTVDSPAGANALTADTCTVSNIPDGSTPSCSFTTDTPGEYTIHVVPENEAGPGAEATSTAFVATVVPDAAVTGLAVARVPGTNQVKVTWTKIAEDDWNGTDRHYDVEITADPSDAVVDVQTCGDQADTDECVFATDKPGSYEVSVTPVNEIGDGPAATKTQWITLQGPTGAVTGLAAVATPVTGTVDVTWSQLPDAAWNSAEDRDYTVTVDGPAAVSLSDCTTVADSSAPSCSFTATVAGEYDITVVPTSEAGDGAVAATTTHVVLDVPTGVVAAVQIANTPPSGVVDLTWPQLTDGWSEGQSQQYTVDIGGGLNITANTCDVVADSATPGCSFTVDQPGPFTVSVKAQNEAGEAVAGSAPQSGTVVFKPTATVAGLSAVAAAPPNSSMITVSWSRLTGSGWQGATSKKYHVTVVGPTNTMYDDDTCTMADVDDSANPSCHFRGSLSGTYTVTVNPVNEAGPSTATAASTTVAVVQKPVATVANVKVLPETGSNDVQVIWGRAKSADWNGAVTTKQYVVTITGPNGATVTPNDCTTVLESAYPACTFTTTAGGGYTVEVALENEAGVSDTPGSSTGHLTLSAPTGQVGPVTVTTAAGSGTVDLSWPALLPGDWSEGLTKSYAVTVTGLTPSATTCTSVPATATPSCSFTVTTPGAFSVLVKAVNEAGTAATGGSAIGTVVLRPTATVSGLAAGTSVGSPTIALTWDKLGAGAWLGGAVKTYVVTVTSPTGTTLSNDTCTVAPVADGVTPACAFDVSTGGDHVIHVAARNEAGISTTSADVTAHVTLVPTAAVTGVNVAVAPGSPTALVTWSRAATSVWNGGSTHSYAVTLQKPAGAVVTGTCTAPVMDAPTPSCGFTTDTPGAYTVSVAPRNEAGTSAAAGTANGTVGSGVPAAATGVSGTGGANSIEVSWTAPVSTTFAGVTDLSVSATATGYPTAECAGPVTTSPCTIADVAAGVPYTVHVIANGPGGSSTDATATVVPEGQPVAPVQVPSNAVPVTPGSGTVGSTITITGSGFDPGSTVVLSLFSNPVDLGTTTADSSGAISATVTLPAGTPTGSHTLLATGLDENGAVINLAKPVSVAAVVTNPPVVTPPRVVPPTGTAGSLTARQTSAGSRNVTVTWSTGSVVWNNGSDRAYRVTVDGPDNAGITGSCTAPLAATATSCTFATDLDGRYTIRVAAVTDAGSSPTDVATSVVVGIAPAAPTAVSATAGTNTMTVKWSAPGNESGIRGYTVTATAPNYPNRSCAGTVTSSPCTITGLAAGVRYTPGVVANGTGGNSPVASGKTAVTPTGSVQAPLTVPSAAVINVSRSARAGSRLVVTGAGYRPSSRVILNIYPGGTLLGTATASSTGAISATVTVPATASGGVAVLATGLTSAGQARYVKTPVRVVATVAGAMFAGGASDGSSGAAAGSTTTDSTPGRQMAVTGPAAGPVLLAGFVLLISGLLLVVAVRKRRTTRP